MKTKRQRGTIEFKADGPQGSFTATFSTFNVIDRDNDVTVPGAFNEGQAVRISAWGHNWGALPVGKGVIHQDDAKAWVDGEFFLDTPHGKDTYQTVKNLGDLQEWSYGFDILEGAPGQFNGSDVFFLRSLDVFEVSPVLLGAGIDTGTDDIKNRKTGARHSAADRAKLEELKGHLTKADALLADLLQDEGKGAAANEDPETGKGAATNEDPSDGADTKRASTYVVDLTAELIEAGVEVGV